MTQAQQSLQEKLEAHKKAQEAKKEATASTPAPRQEEAPKAKPSKARTGFKVFNHPYQFKTGKTTLKPDAEGYYNPTNKEEAEYLGWQAAKGFIHFVE